MQRYLRGSRHRIPALIAIAVMAFSVPGHGQDATPATATAPATAAKPTLSAMDKAASKAERVWLSTASGQRLAFYLGEKTGTTHGGVLIVPDRGVHPAVLGIIDTLRHTLADHHWQTLALNITALDPDTIQQAIAAGVAFMNKKGIFNIAVLGQGRGAAHALRYVTGLPAAAQGKVGQIRALVMLNADNNVPSLGAGAMAPLGQISMPVFDAWYADDYDEQQEAQRREQAAANNTRYQQERLPDIDDVAVNQENGVTKRIRGWLDKNVAGFMVNPIPQPAPR